MTTKNTNILTHEDFEQKKRLSHDMALEEIKNNPDYNFLNEDKHQIIYLTLAGSHSYGTNIETSDIDIRGIALERKEEIIGYQTFNQLENAKTDTVIYGFNEFVKLATDCNPNIIELLATDPSHVLFMSPLGKKIRDNINLFLSRKIYYTFKGYAFMQLKKIENAMARDTYTDGTKAKHVVGSLKRAIDAFIGQHSDLPEDFVFDPYVNENNNMSYKIDIDGITADDFHALFTVVNNTKTSYDTNSFDNVNRNKKKDDAHLNKHAMHLVRLLTVCEEALRTGRLQTYRVQDHDLLMSIRNGDYRDPKTGLFTEAFYNMVEELQQKCDNALTSSPLPKKADMAKVEKFIMEVNEDIVNGKYDK